MKNLIACGIFKTELEAVLTEKAGLAVTWIDAALHADPEKMEEEFASVITGLQGENNDIRFLFGSGCHPDICSIAGKCGVDLFEEKNCIHAFLGVEKTKELEKSRTMIISPGWLEAWQAINERLGWDEVDVRINMGRYDNILILDPGISPISDEAIIEFYDLVQVPVEMMEITLDNFRTFVAKTIGEEV